MNFIEKARNARKSDLTVIQNKNTSPIRRLKKTANLLGRQIIIGNAVGILRVGYGVVKAALCAVATLFLAVAAAVTHRFRPELSSRFIRLAKNCVKHTYYGLEHAVRGAIESVPVLGQVAMVNYDFKKYNDLFNEYLEYCTY